MTAQNASDPVRRRESLKRVYEEAMVCQDCALAQTRTTVVFGAGNADADLMFVGEAPGKTEDERGLPFVGQAGKLLDRLLEEIELSREDVFIVNTLKCRPPGNRDPYPNELQSCQKYLFRQIELIEPTVIATLGNFATKLLRDDPTGITKIHGQAEERVIGPRRVRLYPLYHPAAALYTRSMVEVLSADFAHLPELLRLGPPTQDPPVDDPAGRREQRAATSAAPGKPAASRPEADDGEENREPAGSEGDGQMTSDGGGQLGLF